MCWKLEHEHTSERERRLREGLEPPGGRGNSRGSKAGIPGQRYTWGFQALKTFRLLYETFDVLLSGFIRRTQLINQHQIDLALFAVFADLVPCCG